jgi:hypothetical protein
MAERIPVKVRTARKRHRCDGYPCPAKWIEPGERYEDHRLPPGGDAGYTHWVRHKVHAPTRPAAGANGCDLAGAYQEQAAREDTDGA